MLGIVRGKGGRDEEGLFFLFLVYSSMGEECLGVSTGFVGGRVRNRRMKLGIGIGYSSCEWVFWELGGCGV